MIVPARLRTLFDEAAPFVKHVQKKVRETLVGYAEQEGFAFVGRPKSLESLAEKIESGRFPGWAEIDDLYAATLIIPSLKQEAEALRFLAEAFIEVQVRRRGSTKKPPETFRFDSTRFIGRLRDESEDGGASRFLFEIQIKSAFEHAWAAATHSFAYKAGDAQWARMRVAAQLHAMVEQADTIVLGLDECVSNITPSTWPELERQGRIIGHFKEEIANGRIREEHAPSSWLRFGQNVSALFWSLPKVKKMGLDKALGQLSGCLDEIPPLSITLFQWTLGALSSKGLVPRTVSDFALPISHELEEFYPSTREIRTRFRWGA